MCVWVHWSIRFPRYIKFHHTTIGFPYQHVHSLGVALFFGQETAAEKEKKSAENEVDGEAKARQRALSIKSTSPDSDLDSDSDSFLCFIVNRCSRPDSRLFFFVIVMMTNHLRTESGESSERPRKKEVNFRLNGGLSHGELMANPSGLKAA